MMNTFLCRRLSYCNIRQIYTGLCRNLKSAARQPNNAKHVTEQQRIQNTRIKSGLLYGAGVGVLCLGLAYAAVPLYRVFCQAYSYAGTVAGHDASKIDTMQPVRSRVIKVIFNADTAASMRWNFKPQQTHVKVVPGETALVFYTAKNPLNVPIVGISTYNVVPFDAGQYFNKIQCFCFEEQQLNPHEEVDLPVFFYIDPEIIDDPNMENVDEIILSYTFFEVHDAKITMPASTTNVQTV